MENSKIEWTTHTFNPWHGCMKVSDGCKFCYAETLDNRWKGGHWGPGSSRKSMGDKYWKEPLKWNAAAEKAGVKAKVFCASMADVFEGHPDTLIHFGRLINLIESTPHLIWQLLTKRPENIRKLVPASWWSNGFPENVWIGTSVENQATAELRIPYLYWVPAKVKFLSCEPLLGPVDLLHDGSKEYLKDMHDRGAIEFVTFFSLIDGISWVIVGGESGHKARPMHPDWVRNIRDACKATGVPFFFKQWGEWLPFYDRDKDDPDWRKVPKETDKVRYMSLSGGWGFHGERVVFFDKVGKAKSGSMIDDSEHKEYPKLIS